MLGGYVENDRKRALFHELTELSFEEREARISQAYLEDPLPPDPVWVAEIERRIADARAALDR
jgi:hypothetical protein